MATDTVNCGHCQLPTYGPSFCGNCGEVLPSALKESFYGQAATASSGRTPRWASAPRTRVSFTDSLGRAGQAAYLGSLQRSDGVPGHIADLTDAEELVGACELDRDRAHAELRAALADCPAQPEHRAWRGATCIIAT